MAEETTRRAPAAKKTASSKKAVKSEKASPQAASSHEPGSTSGESSMTARNDVIQGSGTMDTDLVRRRAYELYEQRGGSHGSSEDDWFRAETELLGRVNKGKRSA